MKTEQILRDEADAERVAQEERARDREVAAKAWARRRHESCDCGHCIICCEARQATAERIAATPGLSARRRLWLLKDYQKWLREEGGQ